jgi:hypothetical protein
MTLKALKQAIAELPPEEKSALATWLNEQEMDAWDRQMQRDFSPGANGVPIIDGVQAEVHAGSARKECQGSGGWLGIAQVLRPEIGKQVPMLRLFGSRSTQPGPFDRG